MFLRDQKDLLQLKQKKYAVGNTELVNIFLNILPLYFCQLIVLSTCSFNY